MTTQRWQKKHWKCTQKLLLLVIPLNNSNKIATIPLVEVVNNALGLPPIAFGVCMKSFRDQRVIWPCLNSMSILHLTTNHLVKQMVNFETASGSLGCQNRPNRSQFYLPVILPWTQTIQTDHHVFCLSTWNITMRKATSTSPTQN